LKVSGTICLTGVRVNGMEKKYKKNFFSVIFLELDSNLTKSRMDFCCCFSKSLNFIFNWRHNSNISRQISEVCFLKLFLLDICAQTMKELCFLLCLNKRVQFILLCSRQFLYFIVSKHRFTHVCLSRTWEWGWFNIFVVHFFCMWRTTYSNYHFLFIAWDRLRFKIWSKYSLFYLLVSTRIFDIGFGYDEGK